MRPPRPPSRPAVAPGPASCAGVVVGVALLIATTAVDAAAKGSPPRPPRAPVREEPVGSPIRDVPTAVAVPVSATQCVVLGLPERFWVQVPRVNFTVPTKLDGDGTILQYLNLRGGTVSMLYVGVVPFSPGEGSVETRASNTALDFAMSLGDKYAHVDWAITSGPVGVAPVAMKVGGEKVLAWRSKRYASKPAVAYGGPTSVFSGELLLFHPPGTERLVYVALDAKGGGTTLDKAIEDVSLRPLTAAHPAARRVQLLDLKESASNPSRFPVRLFAFDLPAGFVVTPPVLALTGEHVYAEDRLDEEGRRTASLRVAHRPADPSKPAYADRDAELAFHRAEDRGPVEEVALAAKGHVAWVFEHPALGEPPGARATSAVLRLDDLTLVLTWTTYGDAAARAKDREAFLALVRSLDLTVRW